MGGIHTVSSQSELDMESYPSFSGEIKGAGDSILYFAVTSASKAAKKLDKLHAAGFTKMTRKVSVGKLLAQWAGNSLGNTLGGIRTLRMLLAFGLLVMLLRQTVWAPAGHETAPTSRSSEKWMTDFGPHFDTGFSCVRQDSNQTLLITNTPRLGGKAAAHAGLYLSPPPANRAHLQSPPPTLSWFGLTPSSWQGANPIEMLPVDCAGDSPDKFYCCSEVRRVMSAFSAAGVTSASGLSQCMVHLKALLRPHITFDALNYCDVDVRDYVGPSREDYVLSLLQPSKYGQEKFVPKEDQFSLTDRAANAAHAFQSRRLSMFR